MIEQVALREMLADKFDQPPKRAKCPACPVDRLSVLDDFSNLELIFARLLRVAVPPNDLMPIVVGNHVYTHYALDTSYHHGFPQFSR